MNASSLPARALPRSGPTVPFAPASASVWQPAQPLAASLKTALPSSGVPPPPPPPPPPAAGVAVAAGLFRPASQASYFSLDSTTALARIVACPIPHSSAQTIGYAPSRLGVTT